MKTFKSQSNLKHHMRSTGPCAAKRQLKDEVADRQPNTSTATTPDESSSHYADSQVETAVAGLLVLEDGAENNGGDDNALEEDPIAITEEVRREMRDMMCNIYENNWGAIRTHHRRHNRVQDIYNFRLNELDGERIGRLLLGVYSHQRVQFKPNISFGFMLRHSVNGELRYFHVSHNNHILFERPYYTSRHC
ncbi:hypothetical protein HOLleu_35819 [Holothuria leucospilota]|uniref:Uncharacterized protein n=1 Tax=Holothuria leucospilota TaxID=206669 RepID=A0A9Q1BFM6_HOLLE|nr:hypothetical protein HOLleu_35819 [Holothuria leucospilota]